MFLYDLSAKATPFKSLYHRLIDYRLLPVYVIYAFIAETYWRSATKNNAILTNTGIEVAIIKGSISDCTVCIL